MPKPRLNKYRRNAHDDGVAALQTLTAATAALGIQFPHTVAALEYLHRALDAVGGVLTPQDLGADIAVAWGRLPDEVRGWMAQPHCTECAVGDAGGTSLHLTTHMVGGVHVWTLVSTRCGVSVVDSGVVRRGVSPVEDALACLW